MVLVARDGQEICIVAPIPYQLNTPANFQAEQDPELPDNAS